MSGLRRWVRRVALGFGALVLLVLVAAAVALWWFRTAGLPQRDGAAQLAGLDAAVEVRFDRFGVPHASAESIFDLAAALGWLHANDRITQMELARRLASGRLAELVGPDASSSDYVMWWRGIPQAASRQLGGASPRSLRILEAYASGVNAWLEARAGDLPPGLLLLRTTPEPWKPVDCMKVVMLQAIGLSFLGESEVLRSNLLRRVDPEIVDDFAPGADPLAFTDETAAFWQRQRDEFRARWEERQQGAEDDEELERGGSNNFAVDATRSASGHPLVANDPHLQLGLPALWFQVQLRAPGYEAAGMTLPGLPFVVIGQGPHVAWAVTNSGLDNNDLFLEEIDGDRYRRGDEWVPLRVRKVPIAVKGERTRSIDVRSTDVGPCTKTWMLRAGDYRYASLAWTAFEPQDSIAVLERLAGAETLAAVRDACRDYVFPAQNLLVGHRDEGLLLTVLGRHPRRGRGDGQTPSPGWLPEFHWRGLRPWDEQPLVTAPADGFLATANDDWRPDGWESPFPAELDVPHRARRAREVLATRRDWTARDLARLQTDATSLFALEVVTLTLAERAHELDGLAREARELLVGWDGAMTPDSPAACLYSYFELTLYDAVFGDESGSTADGSYREPGRLGGRHGFGYQRRGRLLRALRRETEVDWIDDVDTEEVETTAEIAVRALRSALERGGERFESDDPRNWRYGARHRWSPEHPLAAAPVVGPWIFGVDEVEVPGSSTTLNALAGHGERVTFGPSMRWVGDTGDPDRSLACLPGGQSGHPFDPHYVDQLDDFLAGRMHPVQWSDDAIERASVSRLVLEP